MLLSLMTMFVFSACDTMVVAADGEPTLEVILTSTNYHNPYLFHRGYYYYPFYEPSRGWYYRAYTHRLDRYVRPSAPLPRHLYRPYQRNYRTPSRTNIYPQRRRPAPSEPMRPTPKMNGGRSGFGGHR